jgi:hypothetical protein
LDDKCWLVDWASGISPSDGNGAISVASVAFGSLPFLSEIWSDKLWSPPADVADGAFGVGSEEEAWASAPDAKNIILFAGTVHEAPHTLARGKRTMDGNVSAKYNFQNCV